MIDSEKNRRLYEVSKDYEVRVRLFEKNTSAMSEYSSTDEILTEYLESKGSHSKNMKL